MKVLHVASNSWGIALSVTLWAVGHGEASQGCSVACKFEGQTATCKARVEWATDHVYAGKPNACEKAHSLVMDQCPHCSHGCSRAEAGCVNRTSKTFASVRVLHPTDKPEQLPGTSSAPEEEPAVGCHNACIYEGKSATCKDRIDYAVQSASAGKLSACDLAYKRVIEQCPSCSACAAAANTSCKSSHTGLTTSAPMGGAESAVTTPSPESIHIPDVRPPPSPAITTKSPSATTSLGQDCMAVFLTCEKGFHATKKEELCHERIGPCHDPGTEQYDCMEVYENCQTGWSVRVIAWALQRDAGPFPTAIPVPTLAPTPAPVEGIGMPSSQGPARAQDSSALAFDCHAGYSNWESGWSSSKKEWCCQYHGLGCPQYARAPSALKDPVVFKRFEQSPHGPLFAIRPSQGPAIALAIAGCIAIAAALVTVSRMRTRVYDDLVTVSPSDVERRTELLVVSDTAKPLYLIE